MEFLNAPGLKRNQCEIRFTALLWQGVGGSDLRGKAELRRNERAFQQLLDGRPGDVSPSATERPSSCRTLFRSLHFEGHQTHQPRDGRAKSKSGNSGNNPRWVDNFGGRCLPLRLPGRRRRRRLLHPASEGSGGTVLIEGGAWTFYQPIHSNVLFYAAVAPERAMLEEWGLSRFRLARRENQRLEESAGRPGFPDRGGRGHDFRSQKKNR